MHLFVIVYVSIVFIYAESEYENMIKQDIQKIHVFIHD